MAWSVGAWWRADRDYFRACRLLRAGKPGEAAKAFDRVIAVFPRHARAHAQRALALAAAGRVGEGVRAARRAGELAPHSHAPLLFLGQIQYDAGRPEEARKAFSAAARHDPENRIVQAWLGLSLLAGGRAEQGAELLKTHLRYANAEVEGRVLALAEQYLREHREGARPLEDQITPEEGGRGEVRAGLMLRLISALRTAMLWPLARLRRGAAAAMLAAEEAMSVGDWEKAIAALRAAEEAGADREQVALTMGQAYLEQRRPEAAAEQFARLSEETRREPDVAALVGAALFESGRYEEGREPLAIAARRFSREYVPCYFRGMCEIALGQPKAAAEWFAKACDRLNPHIAEKRLEEMLRVQAGGNQPGQANT
ncbi:MAG: tetratricopeptide repeat protein [Armatimonadota bacterium]|nr:MAG: tetratricopeptide repeat protein [Armatimonadota bacterium]